MPGRDRRNAHREPSEEPGDEPDDARKEAQRQALQAYAKRIEKPQASVKLTDSERNLLFSLRDETQQKPSLTWNIDGDGDDMTGFLEADVGDYWLTVDHAIPDYTWRIRKWDGEECIDIINNEEEMSLIEAMTAAEAAVRELLQRDAEAQPATPEVPEVANTSLEVPETEPEKSAAALKAHFAETENDDIPKFLDRRRK